jgi:hypothetical protein
MHPAPLVCGALEAAAQRGDQAGVLVGDHQPDPGQAAGLQVGQERPPERLLLAVRTAKPRTSRPPAAVIPVATTTAFDTT